MTRACSDLRDAGFVWVRSAFDTAATAFVESQKLVEECAVVFGHDSPCVIGDFILPPTDGGPTRDFQTLHFDFGAPLDPVRDQDVARYTALFIPPSEARVTAVTRLVPLDALLAQRRWPDQTTVLANLLAYGRSHGAWDDADGYCEGRLARVLEGAAGVPRLPSVKSTPGFLCGMEFGELAAEIRFLASLGLDVETVQIEVPLRPGDLLVFDNLAVAHGRRGSRRPGELHQRSTAAIRLPAAQRALRDRFLALFEERRPGGAEGPARDQVPRARPAAARPRTPACRIVGLRSGVGGRAFWRRRRSPHDARAAPAPPARSETLRGWQWMS